LFQILFVAIMRVNLGTRPITRTTTGT